MRRLPVYLLFFLSGAAGLVYEQVWVRELIFVFGGTTYAITTVLVAFMAGLGLGSYVAGRWSRRWARPGLVYGVLEVGIGVYGLLVPLLLGLAEPLYRAIYPHVAESPGALTLARFAVGALVLLIPTTLMGATLPVLVRFVTAQGREVGRAVARLYGLNTLGAVLGVLMAGFGLIPALGLTRATWCVAAANLLIGAVSLVLFRQVVVASPGDDPARTRPVKGRTPAAAPSFRPSAAQRRVLLVGFAVSGFAAMVYQITWTRALITSLGSSTYAFTCILAAFILGLAVGSLAVARWVDRWRNPVLLFGLLEIAIGLVAVLIVPLHGRVPLIVQELVVRHYADYGALLRWQFLLVMAITFVPTALLGAIFPLVTRALAAGDDASAATGRAYAVNTLGTILGSFLAGFVLIRSDVLGVQNSIVLASVLNGAVGAAALYRARDGGSAAPGWRVPVAIAGLILIVLIGVGAGRWDRRLMTAAVFLNVQRGDLQLEQRKVLYYGEGPDLTVAVTQLGENPDFLSLTVNGKPDASTDLGDMTTQILHAHLPALLAPQAESACVVGLGSGMTLGALALYPHIRQLDSVELSQEVVAGAQYFAPFIGNALTDPRVRMIVADGRNHLLLTDQMYDLIISEPSNPWMAGVANLFTREYFELGKARLKPDGVFAVWMQSYMMAQRDFRMVVRTLLDVFDAVSIWALGRDDYLLIARHAPRRLGPGAYLRAWAQPGVRADLYRIGLYKPAHVLARFIMANEALRGWAGAAPVHTDDNALLEFSAPRHIYSGEREQIAAALASRCTSVLDYLGPDPDGAARGRLIDEIERAAVAHWARFHAEELADRDPVGALRLLVEAYRNDPAHRETYNALTRQAQAVASNRALAGRPEATALLAQAAALRPPTFAPRRGAALTEMAAALRAAADQAAGAGDWFYAAHYLDQLLRLGPADRDVAERLAHALRQLGRDADAAAVFSS